MSESPIKFYTTPELKAGANITITPLSTGELEISSTGEGGGGGTSNAVLYTAQTLTDGQQAQAKKNISLDKVDNTPDSEKPISTAQQAAFTATNDEVARVKQTADSAKATADAAQPAGNYATSAQLESLTQVVSGKQPAGDYVLESELPTELPNPHKLTINGTEYDGSKDVSMVIEGGGTPYDDTEVRELIANNTENINSLNTSKADKTAIPDVSGFATKQELTEGLAGKQPTGDYATNEALTQGLAGKQPVGSYATTAQVDAKLDKTTVATQTTLGLVKVWVEGTIGYISTE